MQTMHGARHYIDIDIDILQRQAFNRGGGGKPIGMSSTIYPSVSNLGTTVGR